MTMLGNETAAPGDPQPTKRAPASKRGVPRGSLAEAEKQARALWNAARKGTVSISAFAQAQGVRTSGGAWKAKMALLRIFHLAIVDSNEKIALSDLGLAIINDTDESAQLLARKQAVLSVQSYAEILEPNDGTPLPEKNAISGRFQFEYSLSKEEANKAADNFFQSVESANLLPSGIVTLGTIGVVNDFDETVSEADEAQFDRAVEHAALEDLSESAAPILPTRKAVQESEPSHELHKGITTVELRVTLDLSKFEADDIIRIINALGPDISNG